jgi:hypothetical protein
MKTAWFDGYDKPVRVGVYRQVNGEGRLGYQRWDGKQWYSWSSSANMAAKATIPAGSSYQNDPWNAIIKESE